MMMTLLDLLAITGLRVGGDPIPFDVDMGKDTGRVEEKQLAWCFLLYVLGASLFPNRRNQVHLSPLLELRDIGQIARYDWGGAALGACYAFMGSLPVEQEEA
ncbi:hypothetical protein RHMOL_Rhmol07G0195200 [Rhododendron molle]|uniref:Uncharacterized protein n=1 Tax=Rhododendron molle TaxID=49168 RepID=A0ACC0N2Q0_RHOML|nr:hypothetical protein RHMOL_Rhmol07G0195200 [Rhododendron molle]